MESVQGHMCWTTKTGAETSLHKYIEENTHVNNPLVKNHVDRVCEIVRIKTLQKKHTGRGRPSKKKKTQHVEVNAWAFSCIICNLKSKCSVAWDDAGHTVYVSGQRPPIQGAQGRKHE